MAIKTFAVIGSGTMGNGIAQTAATAGLNVILVDINQDQLDRAMATIGKSLAKFVEKEKISAADRDAILARITATTSMDDAAARWCQHASDHAASVGGKPWRYLLVPHDAVSESERLADFQRFACKLG